MVRSIKKHYHWLVALLVFLEMIIYGGLINSASVFILPISKALQVPTAQYSVATMPYTVVCFLGTSFSGYLFARFGYKKVALVSIALVAGSLVMTATATNIYLFALSKVLFGLGYGACFTAGSVKIIKDWFWKHQGLVLGAVSMATGLGGSLMTLLLSRLISTAGWRSANWVAAGLMGCIGLLYLLLKDRPEQLGLRPYGFGSLPKNSKKAPADGRDWPGYPMKEQWKRPTFYIMCVCVLASCICLYTTSSFVVPHFISIGLSDATASSYQAIYMLTLAVAKLAIGLLYDRFGAKPVMLGCMACAVAGQAFLGWFTDPVLSLVGILLFAVGLCMTSIMIPLLTAPLFGYRASLSVNGIFLGLSSFSALFSNLISSVCFDATGLYTPVYRVTAIINVGVTALYLVLFALAKKEREKV